MNLTENLYEKRAHGTKFFPFEILSFRIDHSYYILPHWHNEVEILYVVSGKITVTANSVTEEVSSDSFVFINPAEIHSITVSEYTEYFAIIFSADFVSSSSYDVIESKYVTPLKNHSLKFTNFLPVAPPIKLILDEMIDNFYKKASFFEFNMKTGIFSVISQILPYTQETDKTTLKKQKQLSDILSYISNHYCEKILLSDIADAFYMSDKYFSRFFKKNYGISFVDYLNQYRVTEAARLLNETDYRISQVASMCGFDNFSYFSKTFKKFTGKLPKEIRMINHS